MATRLKRMPALFVGHGSPMNAIEESEFSRCWEQLGREIPRPRAILCISAHWETDGVWVTAMPNPKTIHDFSGFPAALYEKQYPAPGDPELAQVVRTMVKAVSVGLDAEWGLDHGTWSVLCRLYPKADIPVLQLSLDVDQSPADHFALARQLAPLREQGVLIVGSGNIVHNLRLMEWDAEPFKWAVAFDRAVKACIETRDHASLIQYGRLGREATMAIPTREHYLPLLYTLALQDTDEAASFFAEGFALGSIGMRGVRIG